jgi:hypothetical protein
VSDTESSYRWGYRQFLVSRPDNYRIQAFLDLPPAARPPARRPPLLGFSDLVASVQTNSNSFCGSKGIFFFVARKTKVDLISI